MSITSLDELGITTHRCSGGAIRSSDCIVFIFAHPDDETFACGGAIARYAATGTAVHYICATPGESGTIASDLLGESSVAEFRTAELLCAAETLGMRAVHLLGYRDSGMSGAPDDQRDDALIASPRAGVVGKLVALLRTLRPQVVVTHGPYGGYGHPDHIRLFEATNEAFSAAGDPTQFPEQGLPPWSPQRLYYTTFDPRPTKIFIAIQRLLRRDPSQYGENGDVDLLEAARQVTPVTCAIDVMPWLAVKERAFRCHRSQLGFFATLLRLPRPVHRLFFGSESYTRAIPPVAPDEPREQGFFPGDSS
jgi:LmbE family N-acetylglucosaminyl deacetylase